MSKIKSLQYLLLDTLKKRKNVISADLASSLKVKEDNDNYCFGENTLNKVTSIFNS